MYSGITFVIHIANNFLRVCALHVFISFKDVMSFLKNVCTSCPKKSACAKVIEIFFPVFRGSVVFIAFTFRCVTDSEYFLYGGKCKNQDLFSCHVEIQPAPFVEKTSLLNYLVIFVEINWPCMCGSMSGIHYVPLILMSSLTSVSHFIYYCSFTGSLEIR